MIAFEVPGEPVAFARARVNVAGKRFTPDKQRNYADAVALKAIEAMRGTPIMEGAVRVALRAVFVPPATWSKGLRENAKWKTSKVDLDNIYKLAADAMSGIVYVDDAQVADLSCQKVYGLRPHLVIEVGPP